MSVSGAHAAITKAKKAWSLTAVERATMGDLTGIDVLNDMIRERD
jgi:hypothetical protein